MSANRITNAIARTAKAIQERLASGATSQAQLDKLTKTLDMDMEEYCRFQELKIALAAAGTVRLAVFYRYSVEI